MAKNTMTYEEYANEKYNNIVNSLGKKVVAKVNKIVAYGIDAGMNIDQKFVVDRYNSALEQYGKEKAVSMLDETLKNTRKKGNEKIKAKWNTVKNEVFEKHKHVPTAIRVLKDEIKSGNIDITGIPSEKWICEQLGIMQKASIVENSNNSQPETDTENSNKLYWYEYRLRGFSVGCQPKGHIKVDHDKGKFGIIAYNRPLTIEELNEYELIPYSE